MNSLDAIDRAITDGYGEIDDVWLQQKSWEDFEKAALNCEVVLFGVGAGMEFYFFKYGEQALVDYIVDNDASLHGIEIGRILVTDMNERCRRVIVVGASILEKLQRDKVVVLITSLRHCREIAENCRNLGLTNVFSLICMESLYRRTHNSYKMEDTQKNYIEESIQKPLERKVLFMTTCDCAGHGKEIARQLKNMDPSVDIVWLVKDIQLKAPEGVRLIHKKAHREYVYERATASIWLTDTGIGRDIPKRDGQICIQMKHWSSITLKMFGYDELNYRNESEKAIKEVFGVDFEGIHDYIIVGSKFDEESCRSGFRFSGKVFYAGSPRSDVLFSPDNAKQEVLNTYPMLKKKNILLFAPTYRILKKGSGAVKYRNDLDFDKVHRILEEKFGGEWVILLRLHPFVANMSKEIEKPDYVVDVSDYYDSEELVAASDILITDYSSIMFEPAFVKKPVFLLATDRERYLREERGFLIDYDTLPFPIAESNDALEAAVRQFSMEEYTKKVDAFMEKYGVHEDGHAGERAAKFILDLLDGKSGTDE